MKLNNIHKIARLLTEDPDIFTESECLGRLTRTNPKTGKTGDGSKCQSTQAYTPFSRKNKQECPEEYCENYTPRQEEEIYPDKSEATWNPGGTLEQLAAAGSGTKRYQKTSNFVTAIVDGHTRLSYASLAIAAKELGDTWLTPLHNKSTSMQMPAQLGSRITLLLPRNLQDYICRGSGKYLQVGAPYSTGRVPSNQSLLAMPIIRSDRVLEAVNVWQSPSDPRHQVQPLASSPTSPPYAMTSLHQGGFGPTLGYPSDFGVYPKVRP